MSYNSPNQDGYRTIPRRGSQCTVRLVGSPTCCLKLLHVIYVENVISGHLAFNKIQAKMNNWVTTEEALRRNKGQTGLFLSYWEKWT
jgi:hypothetical protein